MAIRVQQEDFDSAAEMRALTESRTDIGAVVSFVGLCRGGTISAMTLETYAPMALGELTRIAEDARSRWPLQGLTIIHRHGRLTPGDQIVLVITASAHRRAAFEAADFLMDYLKTRAPFWKAEETASGIHWVNAKADDAAAAERWSTP